jgi:ketosteroid isomerase-like protein
VDNATLVRQAYESFLQNDIQAVLDMLDPAVCWTVPRTVPQGGVFQGVDEVTTFFQGLSAAWEPLGLEIEALGEIGPDLVVGVTIITGVLAGDPVSYGSVHVFTLRHGKIIGFREYVDLNGALAG